MMTDSKEEEIEYLLFIKHTERMIIELTNGKLRLKALDDLQKKAMEEAYEPSDASKEGSGGKKYIC